MPEHTLVSQLKATSLPPESCIRTTAQFYHFNFFIHGIYQEQTKACRHAKQAGKEQHFAQSNPTTVHARKHRPYAPAGQGAHRRDLHLYAQQLHAFPPGKGCILGRLRCRPDGSYEAYLKSTGVGMNTISFYNRILRAVYNRAVEKGLRTSVPFKHVYTGVEKPSNEDYP